jgi:hypothetical protein
MFKNENNNINKMVRKPIMGITVKRVIELHKIMGHASGDKMAKAIREGCWINLPNENELTSQVIINRVMNRHGEIQLHRIYIALAPADAKTPSCILGFAFLCKLLHR